MERKITRIGLITYDHPHLKTDQVFHMLLNRKKNFEYKIYALPFKQRKKRNPLIKHRPNQENAVHPIELAKYYNIPYIKCETDKDIDDSCDIYLILGAGILSAECVYGKRIVNSHPGIIPIVRGLDAFKWSIYQMKPLGVTLHFIDVNVDAGEIISIIPTPVYPSDTIETLARRHYENEIYVLAHFDIFLNNPVNPFGNLRLEPSEPNRRMSREMEEKLLELFLEYKKKFSGNFLKKYKEYLGGKKE